MYLLSVKSFMTRVPGALVVAHSDGSLDAGDLRILEAHLPGLQIVPREAAEKKAQDHADPFIQNLRHYGGTFDRLIDSVLWRQGYRHIQMDSDILTTKSPDYIIRWVESGNRPFVISDYEKKETREISPNQPANEHIQTQLEKNQQAISEKTGMDFGNTIGLCSGLYGWQNELLPEDIRKLVETCESLGFDMKKWGAEQVITTWLLNAKGAERLPVKAYINLQENVFRFRESASMIHFIGSHRFRAGWYARMAKKEIARLMAL
ncbi:hypothetical protein [Desulfonema ishimotonii]|nr:hypothetical protein [Desulfonema ishimotonii]